MGYSTLRRCGLFTKERAVAARWERSIDTASTWGVPGGCERAATFGR
jgi:hypothetical protein